MVKDPLGEWDKVYTFCALLVDLGLVQDHAFMANWATRLT